ncbi:MAG TPA: ferritin family protein [Candidatus Cloacimonadota bacterium]|nr:ferritin family protein [Candidatus Cloacimonadota bacterium]HQL14911.1 ferritin family protein [Candidatus Cloacimonadota bacterium]
MTIQEFNEVLDFAVEREKEAVQFYHELQEQAHFAGQKDFLKELESMEQGHINVIENLRLKQPSEMDIKTIPNLQFSEYLVSDVDDLDLTYPNLLIKAMKREEISFKLYGDLSRKFQDSELAKLFTKLANEEAGHKYKFEQLYDEWLRQGN